MPDKPDERTAAATGGSTTALLPEVDASSGVYAKVASLLHDARRESPDRLGSFLRRSVAAFGMRDVSVYVADFEQRRLVPIAGSAVTVPLDIAASAGGLSFTSVRQVEEPVAAGVRLWSHAAQCRHGGPLQA